MTVQEVMEKEIFGVEDIKIIFQCGKSTAYKIIRQIKSVSDIINISGRIHKKDYLNYINRPINR